jgi:hypothetical protein
MGGIAILPDSLAHSKERGYDQKKRIRSLQSDREKLRLTCNDCFDAIRQQSENLSAES